MTTLVRTPGRLQRFFSDAASSVGKEAAMDEVTEEALRKMPAAAEKKLKAKQLRLGCVCACVRVHVLCGTHASFARS